MDSSNDFFSGQYPAAAGEDGLLPVSLSSPDPQIPLLNLSLLHRRMDSLRQSLSASLHSGSKLHPRQIHLASYQISSAIRHAIFNATALLNSSHPPPPAHTPPPAPAKNPVNPPFWEPPPGDAKLESGKAASFREMKEADYEIVELDAVGLLADHVHFCDICGKGFKRDANLRMHMRAHGNQFKTPEALAKPGRMIRASAAAGIRFSCPFPGCIRNRAHRKFRPLKSAICVKNHFKRSHCPKMYACNRCHKKSFSVVADLKSHLKHCGECRWKCSCGTSFSRKDKLFGHLALFEGHMPAVVGDLEKEKLKEVEIGEENDDHKDDESSSGFGSLDALLDGFSTMDECSFEGLLGLQSEEVRLEDLGKV